MEILAAVMAAIVVISIVGCAAISRSMFLRIFSRSQKSVLHRSKDLDLEESARRKAQGADWIRTQSPAYVEIQSDDGLHLKAWFLRASQPTPNAVILLHGYASDGSSMAELAQFYREKLGFHVLIPDARGHGRSDGEYRFLLTDDAKDVVSWVYFIHQRVGNDASIVLHGLSMGAAAAMMAPDYGLPDTVRCIVSESGFASMEGILCYQLERIYKLPVWPILPVAEWHCRRLTGRDLKAMRPLQSVHDHDVPLMVIHGERDTFVPPYMAKQLYDSASGDRELLMVRLAGHAHCMNQAPVLYQNRLIAFLSIYLYF